MSPSRRTILKSSTGLVTGIGFLSTASAETDDKVAPGEVGLEDKIKELSKKNEVEEIRRLIEKHDLKAAVTEASIHPDDVTDDDGVSTDAYMREDESSVSVTVTKNYRTSGYYASGTADLKDQRAYWTHRKNGARANDGILLFWDNFEMTSRDGAAQENAYYSAYPTENASSDTEITAIYDG